MWMLLWLLVTSCGFKWYVQSEGGPITTICVSIWFWLRYLLLQGKTKIRQGSPSQACCSLNKDAIDWLWVACLLSAIWHHDWVFPLLLEMWHELRMQILYHCLLRFGWIKMYLSKPTIGSWWSQWVVMAACHCYLWWTWWSDTLWATLIRSWLHPLSCYPQIAFVEISLQFHRCMLWILWVHPGEIGTWMLQKCLVMSCIIQEWHCWWPGGGNWWVWIRLRPGPVLSSRYPAAVSTHSLWQLDASSIDISLRFECI